MDAQGTAALIVALTGALATAGALVQNRRGRAEQNRQQTAADQALNDKGRLAETQQALDTQRDLIRDLRDDVARKDSRIESLEGDLDTERERRRTELGRQEERCANAHAAMVEIVETLRAVVVDEISRAAAGERVAMVRPHPHPLPAPPRADPA